MTLPAARVADPHVCPMCTGPVPHVGGPIATPFLGALIGGSPPAAATGMGVCVGPPDLIAKGSATVMVGGRPLARLSDTSGHGGTIVAGCFTVLVGG